MTKQATLFDIPKHRRQNRPHFAGRASIVNDGRVAAQLSNIAGCGNPTAHITGF